MKHSALRFPAFGAVVIVLALAATAAVSPVGEVSSPPGHSETQPAASTPSFQVTSTVVALTGQFFSGNTLVGPPNPDGLTYDPVNARVYIADGSGMIWGQTPSVSKFIDHSTFLGGSVTSIALDPQNNHLFAVDQPLDEVVVLNASTGGTVAVLATGPSPEQAVYDPANGLVYISNAGADNLTAINPTTAAVVGSVLAGTGPTQLAVDGWNGRLFVSNGAGCGPAAASCNVSVVDPSNGSLVTTVALAGPAGGLSFDNQTGEIFAAVQGSDQIVAINGNTSNVTKVLSLGSGPSHLPHDIAFDYRDRAVFVPQANGTIAVVAAGTDTWVKNVTIPLASPDCHRITYDPADRLALLTYNPPNGSGAGAAIVGFSTTPSYGMADFNHLEASPQSVFFNSETRQLAALDAVTGDLAMYNSKMQVVTSNSASGFGPLMAANTNNKVHQSGDTYVTDSNAIVAVTYPTPGLFTVVSDPHGPTALAFDGANGDLYAGNADGNLTVYHAAGGSLIATISLAAGASGATRDSVRGVALDALNGMVYASVSAYSPSNCSGVDWVYAINTSTNAIAGSAKVTGSQFGNLVADGADGYVYVVDNNPACPSSRVEVFRASTLAFVTSLMKSTSDQATAIAFDVANKAVYVTSGAGTLTKILGGTHVVAGVISVGLDPLGVAYDGTIAEIVVANAVSGSYSLITP